MTIEQMICFLTVAECKNFTKAANRLYVTQPALSRTIVTIESDVGVNLFKRTKRSVELTPAGKRFVVSCQKIVNDYHKALEEARACSEGIAGHLRIGFTSSAAEQILPKLINKLMKEYQGLDIQLYDGTYFEIMELLNESRLDVGIVSDLAINTFSHLEARLISEDNYCLVVSKTHWAAELECVRMDQILQEEFVTIDRNRVSIDFPITDRNLLSHTLVGDNYLVNIVNSAKSIHSLLIMISCGQGVSILAKHTQICAPESVCYIPIIDFNRTFKASLVWNIDNPNPYIARISDILDWKLL